MNSRGLRTEGAKPKKTKNRDRKAKCEIANCEITAYSEKSERKIKKCFTK